MTIKYKCFNCNKNVAQDYIRKNVRCPYCGSKILYKPRSNVTKVKAK
ncbi:DNA-directed RNA polymerase subunit P [Candidatus Woesearchaeota archaeon]|nr:DNA-directed RNA polymerase subunit P [Candidatus Woesearchaeota archaeon]